MSTSYYPVSIGTEVNLVERNFIQWKNGRPLFKMRFPNNAVMGETIRDHFSDPKACAVRFNGTDRQKGIQLSGKGEFINTHMVDEHNNLITAEEMDRAIESADCVIYYP